MRLCGLKDKADLFPAQPTNIKAVQPFPVNGIPVKDNLTRAWFQNQADAQQQSGLAGAAGTHQGYQITCGNREINIFQGPHFHTAAAENLAQARNPEGLPLMPAKGQSWLGL